VVLSWCLSLQPTVVHLPKILRLLQIGVLSFEPAEKGLIGAGAATGFSCLSLHSWVAHLPKILKVLQIGMSSLIGVAWGALCWVVD